MVNKPAMARSTHDLMAELEALRAEVRARNPDLTAEQAEQLAVRITRDAINALVDNGGISFASIDLDDAGSRATPKETPMATIQSPPVPAETRMFLHDVTWQTYECLLVDHGDRRAPRFAYDRGVLEIMSPGSEHERTSTRLALLVDVVAEEWGIDIDNLGSMTFRREDFQRGFEPDSCFYIRHEALVRDREQIDPAVDPPPDLLVEVDITSPSLDKFPIYAQMGVPEVWRYDGRRIAVHLFTAGAYREASASAALPPLTGDLLTRFLAESRTHSRTAWLRMLRAWARQHRPRTQAIED